MKHLVKHLVQQHHTTIASKSLLNCHVKGLHSIMLVDAPEQRIRLFVTTEDHELWQNTSKSLGSLAAHAHHCDVTLHCVAGHLVNLEYDLTSTLHQFGPPLRPFHYTSGLLHKTANFIPAEGPSVVLADFRALSPGLSVALPAYLIHSVQVPKGVVAAWFVYEGREDPAYQSLSYSDQPLSQASFDDLYQPMSETDVVRLLHSVGLYD